VEFSNIEKRQKKKEKELEKLDKVKIGYACISSQNDQQKLGLEVQAEAFNNCDIIF